MRIAFLIGLGHAELFRRRFKRVSNTGRIGIAAVIQDGNRLRFQLLGCIIRHQLSLIRVDKAGAVCILAGFGDIRIGARSGDDRHTIVVGLLRHHLGGRRSYIADDCDHLIAADQLIVGVERFGDIALFVVHNILYILAEHAAILIDLLNRHFHGVVDRLTVLLQVAGQRCESADADGITASFLRAAGQRHRKQCSCRQQSQPFFHFHTFFPLHLVPHGGLPPIFPNSLCRTGARRFRFSCCSGTGQPKNGRGPDTMMKADLQASFTNTFLL